MSINTTDVVAEWGAYYADGGQGESDVLGMFYQGGETTEVLTLQPTKKTRLEKASASISSVLQAYQKDFTPKGDTAFQPRVIPMYKLKIDWEEVPDDIEESWLGFLASNGHDRSDWPFIRYVIEHLIMKQEIEDMENDVIFKGEKGAITPGTATTAAASMNGLKKVINDHITAGDIVPIVTGAASADPETWVDQVEDFFAAIDEKFHGSIKTLQMSKTLAARFRKGMRAKYNMGYDQAEITKIIDTEVVVTGLASHSGSDKIWCTVKDNAVLGVKKPENQGDFKVETAKRAVSVFTDYYKGVGFWIPEYVFTNDRDLAV